MSKLAEAKTIALASLRACYSKDGIIAGPHHFTDYWARDGFFAAFGSLAVGDLHIVEAMLALFFSYQRPDGLIPYRIMRGPISLGKYLGKPKFYQHPHATYKLRGIGQPIYDGTTLSLLFAALTKNPKYLPQIKKGLIYLSSREKNGLLWDGPMAEWNDAVWKYGNLLYSNVIYWYMYDRLADWLKVIDPTFSTALSSKANGIADSLRSRLWNGKYFADWHDYKRQDYFYPFGNSLAITWGLTTKTEANSIFEQCSIVQHGFTLETNSPQYPWWRTDLAQRLIGMPDYQNQGILWWQPITSYLTALKSSGRNTEYSRLSQIVINKIIQDQEIYECYERDGTPVKRWLYTSEHPFAWTSGMILWSLGAH